MKIIFWEPNELGRYIIKQKNIYWDIEVYEVAQEYIYNLIKE